MSEELRIAAGVLSMVGAWLLRFVWSNHKSLNNLREEIAAEYPTWTEMKKELQNCSDQKDKMFEETQEDLKYIRDKVDMLIQREMNKND